MELQASDDVGDLKFVTRLYALRKIDCSPLVAAKIRPQLVKLGCAERIQVGNLGDVVVEESSSSLMEYGKSCCRPL